MQWDLKKCTNKIFCPRVRLVDIQVNTKNTRKTQKKIWEGGLVPPDTKIHNEYQSLGCCAAGA